MEWTWPIIRTSNQAPYGYIVAFTKKSSMLRKNSISQGIYIQTGAISGQKRNFPKKRELFFFRQWLLKRTFLTSDSHDFFG